MGKHYNPIEKEFLIRQYKLNGQIKLRDFCDIHNISDGAFKNWLKKYEDGGLEVLARADAEIREVLPDGEDRAEEAYKREILRLRIENERLRSCLKFNSMFFLKNLNGIFSTFPQLQWNPISFADVSLARQKIQASFALTLRNAAPSERRKICSSMSIIKFIN